MFIVDWWNSLTTAAQIFACVAIPSTLVLLIQTILMLIGIGGESDGIEGIEDVSDGMPDDIPDSDVGDGVFGEDMDTEAPDTFGIEGLRIFTLRGIVAFFVVFGWVGVVMDGSGVALWLTLLVSAVCGFAMMFVLAFLMRAVMKLRNDGNTDNRNAIGTSGKVYLTIPPARTGDGKVSVMLQGSYVERSAVTDDEEAIPTGSEIVVVGVSGQTDLVVRRK
ncbi:MAG: NfeD family protein [Clostridia bacterium]|nr:NfeD family protein [Clostridia bacterium]